MKFFEMMKFEFPTDPEPSTKNTRSSGELVAHTGLMVGARVGTRVGRGVGTRVGLRVGGLVGGESGVVVTAVQTVVAIDWTMLDKPVKDAVVNTRAELPAMDVSSLEPMPDPTPTAKIWIPLARAAAAAVPGLDADWPSVSTTSTLAAPGRDDEKIDAWVYAMASAV
jgi:hypothetical protein